MCKDKVRDRDVTFPCLVLGMEAWKKDETCPSLLEENYYKEEREFNYYYTLVLIFLIYDADKLVRLQRPFVFISLFGLPIINPKGIFNSEELSFCLSKVI